MFNSSLFDEMTFYGQFKQDLLRCKSEVVIESPYITSQRTASLHTVIQELVRQNVKVYVLTRDPREHTDNMTDESEAEIRRFEKLGVQVYL